MEVQTRRGTPLRMTAYVSTEASAERQRPRRGSKRAEARPEGGRYMAEAFDERC